MVVLFGATGQLCNRLFSISAFVSNTLEHGYSLKCMGFEEYYLLFEDINKTTNDKNIKFNEPLFFNLVKAKGYYKLGSLLRRLKKPLGFSYFGLYEKGGDLNQVLYKEAVKKHRHLLVAGWPYWDVENFVKHSDFLRKVFTPKAEYADVADSFIAKHQEGYDVLVAVHVRRGDYKEYYNGMFYYEDEQYLKMIEYLQLQFHANSQKAKFIVFSNEKVNISSATATVVKANMNAICDLTAMASCNYIIGPPSTFSMWASFYGQVPYKCILEPQHEIALADFSPVIAPNTYANGKHIID